MSKKVKSCIHHIALIAVLVLCLAEAGRGQLNENCVVSVLNRSVRVNRDGSWVLPNIPAGFGNVKARATCVENGVTRFGESAFFNVATNNVVNLPKITLGTVSPIPTSLTLDPTTLVFNSVGQTIPLNVTAKYPDGSTKNVTAAALGTNYTTSNPSIATVGSDGRVTATGNGVVLIQAINDGTPGFVRGSVVLSGVDTDNDGIPDADEVALGLDPRNPVDAEEDYDRDGLTNLQEYRLATNIRKADTDGDGLSDGDEFLIYHSDPLVVDTDGDRIPDGIEVTTKTNPLDRNSYDLKKATGVSLIQPSPFFLTTNVLFAEVSQLLSWKATLIDGKTTLDLIADSRTTYASNNLVACNFGSENGKVYAGEPGTCLITLTNNTLTQQVQGIVRSFTPVRLSYLDIPGFANNVDVSGDYAYIAAGAAGLQIVDVKNRQTPRIAASLALAGNANDVVVAGNFAYVAAGSAGLHVVNISNPLSPVLASTHNTGGVALDVVVKSNRAYVANGTNGLVIVDVASPAAPTRLGSISLTGTATGVDADSARQIAVVAMSTNGFAVVNISNPLSPSLLSTLDAPIDDVRDVAISGNFAFLADFARGFTPVDLTNPSTPVVLPSARQDLGGLLLDVAVVGTIATGADVFFVNGVPLIDVTNPANPRPRAILNFNFGIGHDLNGTGIAMDGAYVYLTATSAFAGTENGTTGFTRLYIGQYRGDDVTPPTVNITTPTGPITVTEGDNFDVSVAATDNLAVASVSVLLDGQVVDTRALPPYQFSVNGPVGQSSATLTARATDFGGNTTDSSEVTINIAKDLIKPTVRVTSPTPGTVPEASVVTEVVDASDDVRVTRVEFLVNDTIFATKTQPPYEAFFTVPAGATALRLSARGFDPAGNAGVAPEVLLSVSSDPPPMVRILSPASGIELTEGDQITVSIEATDNGAVLAAELDAANDQGQIVFRDIRNVRQFPFTVFFGSKTITLTAKATDNLGQTSTSTPVIINVKPEPAPVVKILSPPNGGEVIAGAAVPINVDATDDVSIKWVSAVPILGIDETAPYQFLFAAPPAGFGANIEVVAVDNLNKGSERALSTITSIEDPLTTLQGTVVDSGSTPLTGLRVMAAVHGLSAQVVDLPNPLTTLPPWTSLTPGPGKMISTPISAQVGDPFGFGLLDIGRSRVMRFAGKLKTTVAGVYTFSMYVHDGGLLKVSGSTVIDLSTISTEIVQFGTGSIALPAGDVPIELLTFYNQDVQQLNSEVIQLSYTPPGGQWQGIPSSMFTPELSLFESMTQADGSFRIPNVPTAFGDLAAVVVTGSSGNFASNARPPIGGGVTDVGTMVLGVSSSHDAALPLSKISIPGFANSVAVQSNSAYAYVAAGVEGLQIIDISDKAHPQIVNSVSLNGNANDVKIAGNYAYVADGTSGLVIVDITDPLAAAVVGSIAVGGDAWGVATDGNLVLIAKGPIGGMVVVQPSPVSAPVMLGSVSLPGISKSVAMYEQSTGGRRLAVVVGTTGLAVLDVDSNPSNPILLGTLQLPDARDVVIGPGAPLAPYRRAFVADASVGTVVINLQSPTMPQIEAVLNDGSFNGIAASSTRAVAAGRPSEDKLMLPIYDLTTGTLSRRVIDFGATFGDPLHERGTGAAVDGNFVYLTTAAGTGSIENGVTGITFFYIGQHFR